MYLKDTAVFPNNPASSQISLRSVDLRLALVEIHCLRHGMSETVLQSFSERYVVLCYVM
jgi:hypothetical protein